MVEYLSYLNKRIIRKINAIRVKIGLYHKEKLPEYNFSILQEKWPYRDPQCIKEKITHNDESVDLSICIPMYNVQSYIIKLLKQIDNQKTKYAFEVLLIDDGSSDETNRLVSDYIKEKATWHLFSQENLGISAARNRTIDNARGRYLSFIDADDEISEDFIDSLLTEAYRYNCDIVNGRYSVRRGNKIYPRGIASGYVWGGVYRASLFNQIRFPDGYWYEDMINSFLLIPSARCIHNIENIVVIHNDIVGSQTKIQHKAKNYKALEALYLVLSLADDFIKLGLNDQKYFNCRLIHECSLLMSNRISVLDEDTKKQVFLACNHLFNKYNVNITGITGIDKVMAVAIIKKDYAAWIIAGNTI